jgi:DNA polymerase I-like protein with 3'-5' exonuclease and polymerase domains
MIQAHGFSKPAAFLIADQPYGDDIRTNYAITGFQENQYRQYIKHHNLDFNTFWRTCLIKDPPPKAPPTDTKSKTKRKLEDQVYLDKLASQYGKYLIEEIKDLSPHLLIPLGETSFRFLTQLNSIRKFRGSVLPSHDYLHLDRVVKVLPILGVYPFINQDYKLRMITQLDFGKVGKYLNDFPLPDSNTNVWIARNSEQLRAFIERSYDVKGLLVFDIETYMGIPTCISFCFNGIESVCIPFIDREIDRGNLTLMMDLVARVLNSDIRKVNQNIKYDWKILERWGFRVRNVVGDTMLAASCLYCEFPKNLGFLTSIYTDLPYFKDEGREFDPAKHKREQFYLYNAKDSLATHQIHIKQNIEIDERGVRDVYSNLIQLMPIYRRMEDRGIRIDQQVRAKLYAKYTTLFNIQVRTLRKLMNCDTLNPLSSKQMTKVIFEDLEYKYIRGVTGTDEDSLEMLMVYGHSRYTNGQQVLETILSSRKVHKVIEILELALYPDGRFRCEFNLSGTETGRTSAGTTTDTLLKLEDGKICKSDLGHSLQTIGKHGFVINGVTYGKDIRSMFVPSHGYSFVECDLSQAEARVDAVLAGNCDILSVFDGPVGIHRLTGSWCYGCDPTDISKTAMVEVANGIYVNRYYAAKIVRHAGERNIREDRLSIMLQIPISESRKILATFHKHQPEIKETFHRDVINCISVNRSLVAPNGRRRDFYGRPDNHTFNEGISFLPQAIVSDKTKFSLIPTLQEMPRACLLTEQHDGALFEVPIGLERDFIHVYKKNVETPIDFRACSLSRNFDLSIPAEGSIGMDWYNMEEMKV